VTTKSLPPRYMLTLCRTKYCIVATRCFGDRGYHSTVSANRQVCARKGKGGVKECICSGERRCNRHSVAKHATAVEGHNKAARKAVRKAMTARLLVVIALVVAVLACSSLSWAFVLGGYGSRYASRGRPGSSRGSSFAREVIPRTRRDGVLARKSMFQTLTSSSADGGDALDTTSTTCAELKQAYRNSDGAVGRLPKAVSMYDVIYAALVCFKDTHGHLDVPTSFVVPTSNYSWRADTWSLKLGHLVPMVRQNPFLRSYERTR
jgi:hypothetical protein